MLCGLMGLALDKLMGNLYSKLVFSPALSCAKIHHPKLITTYMTGCNLLTGRGEEKVDSIITITTDCLSDGSY